MKTITLKSPDGKAEFQIIAYRAKETVQVFQGATGEFNTDKKSAGLIYVRKDGGISADDHHVDDESTWNWIQEWMQKGMDADAKIEAMEKALDRIRLYGHSKNPADDIAQLQLIAKETRDATRYNGGSHEH